MLVRGNYMVKKLNGKRGLNSKKGLNGKETTY